MITNEISNFFVTKGFIFFINIFFHCYQFFKILSETIFEIMSIILISLSTISDYLKTTIHKFNNKIETFISNSTGLITPFAIVIFLVLKPIFYVFANIFLKVITNLCVNINNTFHAFELKGLKALTHNFMGEDLTNRGINPDLISVKPFFIYMAIPVTKIKIIKNNQLSKKDNILSKIKSEQSITTSTIKKLNANYEKKINNIVLSLKESFSLVIDALLALPRLVTTSIFCFFIAKKHSFLTSLSINICIILCLITGIDKKQILAQSDMDIQSIFNNNTPLIRLISKGIVVAGIDLCSMMISLFIKIVMSIVLIVCEFAHQIIETSFTIETKEIGLKNSHTKTETNTAETQTLDPLSKSVTSAFSKPVKSPSILAKHISTTDAGIQPEPIATENNGTQCDIEQDKYKERLSQYEQIVKTQQACIDKINTEKLRLENQLNDNLFIEEAPPKRRRSSSRGEWFEAYSAFGLLVPNDNDMYQP